MRLTLAELDRRETTARTYVLLDDLAVGLEFAGEHKPIASDGGMADWFVARDTFLPPWDAVTAAALRSLSVTSLRAARTRCTRPSCTLVCGYAVRIASGKPINPSTQTIEADQGAVAVVVVACRALAVRAVHAGCVVAVLF